MDLKDLDIAKLSKLTSDYIDEVKCLECCKYFIAPETAACGHTLCHTCWRGRRFCPVCATSVERKSLKLNLPLQNLTDHVQALGEAFEKLFNIKLDEFEVETPRLEQEKDPVKNVKDWLTSSQNHFSAPVINSEPFSQDSQQLGVPLQISSSKIMIHTDAKKSISPKKKTEVVHVPPPQDDWDKIEMMPDPEEIPKNNENIVGPMDIEPFFMDDSEYTTDNPRRSSRKRDVKHDDNNQKAQNLSSNNQRSRESSCEPDKKSQKGKQTWNNVKRMRKEFSKLNKKNRNKLNVSIEMVKKTQNVKTNTPSVSNTVVSEIQQIMNIDDNTQEKSNKENEKDENVSSSIEKTKERISDKNPTKQTIDNNLSADIEELNAEPKLISKDNNNITVNDNIIAKSAMQNVVFSVESDNNNKSQEKINNETKMSFVKKGALCPKNVNVILDNVVNNNEAVTVNSDDIEISIKIGNTITNILIKKKNDVQVKINTDREVQTSLEPQTLNNKELLHANKQDKNEDIVVHNISKTQTITNKSLKTVIHTDKSTTGKKNTASADTVTAPQFEITESVEKELSSIMEYETVGSKEDMAKNTNTATQTIKPVLDEVENMDDINDLDIFNSGSVKEGHVHTLKEHAPSEILISTVGSKLRTQRNAEKRNRENAEEDVLPETKKVKVASQVKSKNKSVLPDSEPNYDEIMGQVFANIDADIEEIKKTQETQVSKTRSNKDLSVVENTQILNTKQTQNQVKTLDNPEYINQKHSENVFSIIEKDDEHIEIDRNDQVPQPIDFLTPVVCHNIDSSQEGDDVIQKTGKSNKRGVDDDSDRSVVEETPQKDLSIPKLKRASTSNLSQIAMNETRKIPSKAQSIKSIINLTDTDMECNKTNRDVTILENDRKKMTLETPLTITKFADHIIHKSTPVARKSLQFNNENDDNDPEQTLCPTTDVIAKTTQEKEFMSKAFEKSPMSMAVRPLTTRNLASKMNRKYCLAGSCLTSSEIASVKTLCSQRKWSYVDKYTKDVTHLVVGVDEEMKAQRSVKYMCALAASKWIVSFDWITNCLRNKEIVDEEKFEALDSTGESGPRRSRVANHKLFQGIKFYCMPPFSVLDVNTLKNMLMAAGGRVVKEMKEVRVTDDSPEPALLLAEPEHTQEDRFIYLAMEQSIVPVNYEWVLNCLGGYSLGSIQELLLCPSSLLPPMTTQWPEILLTQDYD